MLPRFRLLYQLVASKRSLISAAAMHPLRFPDFAPTHALYRTTHPQAEAEELRAELERMRTSLDGLKAAQNEYVKSAKKVQRVERKLADRQAAGKVGGGSLRPADMLGEVGRQ